MAELDAVAAAKYFKDAKILVQMPKLDKDGNPVRNPETKRIVTVDEDLEPRHIVGVREFSEMDPRLTSRFAEYGVEMPTQPEQYRLEA